MHARRQQEGRGRLSGTPPRAHAERREAAEQAYFTGNMAAQASTPTSMKPSTALLYMSP